MAEAGRSSSEGLRLLSLRALLLLSLALALLASALALGITAIGGVHCSAYPSCLLDQPSWAVSAHFLTGAVLGLTLLGALVLALTLRQGRPGLLPAAGATFALVVVMGGIGAGLATGALSYLLLFVQSALVVLLVCLVLWTYFVARRPVQEAAPRPVSHVEGPREADDPSSPEPQRASL